MVRVLENVFTFETGGGPAIWRNVEGVGGPNCSLVSTPSPPFSSFQTYCLKCIPNIKDNTWVTPTLTQSGVQIIGVAIQFNDVTPIANFTQDIIVITSAGGIDWKIRMEGIGPVGSTYKFQLVEADGTVTDIDSDIFPVDTWITFDFSWTQGNSENLRIHINGSIEYSLLSKDLQAGSGGNFTITIGNGAVGPILFFKNLYAMFDAIALIDELHFIITRAYRIGKDSTSPDSDTSGTPGSGQTLDAGNWKEASDAVIGGPGYTASGDEGAVACVTTANNGVPGPKGDVHRDTVILGAKWMAEFNGGFSVGQTDLLFGNRTEAYIFSLTAIDTNAQRVHRFTHFLEPGDPGNRVPNTQENIAIGFGKTNVSADTITMREGWAMVVYQTDSGGDLTSPPDPTVHIQGGAINGGAIL